MGSQYEDDGIDKVDDIIMTIKISIDDNDDDLDLKVNIFSLVNLRLQLPHNGCICRPPVSFNF